MEALKGLSELLLILLSLGVLFLAYLAWRWAVDSGFLATLLNLAVAVAGVVVIFYLPGEGMAWLVGLVMVGVGGFNCFHMTLNLIKHGDADYGQGGESDWRDGKRARYDTTGNIVGYEDKD